MSNYREIKSIEQRLNQIRKYLKDISPRLLRHAELKAEEKQLLEKLRALAV